VFEARVITLCDRDIVTNFGAVAGEVILVDSCACTVIFICCDSKKKIEKQNFYLRRYCSLAAAVLFKTDLLVELGIGPFFFLKGNDVLNRTSGKPLAPPYRGQIPLFYRVFRQFLFSTVGFSYTLHCFRSLVWLVSFEFS
jgi:hypothetical protein